MTHSKQNISRRFFGKLGSILASGCAANAPYHASTEPASICATAPNDEACLDRVYQEFASHDIAFAEFSERGNAFDDKAIASVLARIEQHADNTSSAAATTPIKKEMTISDNCHSSAPIHANASTTMIKLAAWQHTS